MFLFYAVSASQVQALAHTCILHLLCVVVFGTAFGIFLHPGSKQQLQWFLQWISIEVTELLEAENWKISWTADSGVTTVIYFWDTVVRRNLSYIMEYRIASVVNRIFHSACNFREEGLHSFHAGDLCWKH